MARRNPFQHDASNDIRAPLPRGVKSAPCMLRHHDSLGLVQMSVANETRYGCTGEGGDAETLESWSGYVPPIPLEEVC